MKKLILLIAIASVFMFALFSYAQDYRSARFIERIWLPVQTSGWKQNSALSVISSNNAAAVMAEVSSFAISGMTMRTQSTGDSLNADACTWVVPWPINADMRYNVAARVFYTTTSADLDTGIAITINKYDVPLGTALVQVDGSGTINSAMDSIITYSDSTGTQYGGFFTKPDTFTHTATYTLPAGGLSQWGIKMSKDGSASDDEIIVFGLELFYVRQTDGPMPATIRWYGPLRTRISGGAAGSRDYGFTLTRR